MTSQEAETILEDAAAKIGEHFDAVQILASWNEDGMPMIAKRGVGNWYARQGMAHEFITSDIAQDAAIQIAEKLNQKPEDGDDWKHEST